MLTRYPVYTRHAMIASSQPLALSAGQWALHQGGNFIDAAIAVSAVLCVVEPWASQLGGDAFAVLYEASTGQTLAFNGSGKAPRKASRSHFPQGIPLRGMASATVPGLVDCWFALHERHGTIAISKLLEPAIEYAQNGFPVSEYKQRRWSMVPAETGAERLLNALIQRETPPKAGEVLRCEDLAWTLNEIALDGRHAFYEGEVLNRMIAYSREHGGLFEPEDFRDHRTEIIEPLNVAYRDFEVHGQPPVSQGIILLEALKILGQANLKDMTPVERAHLMIEAIKCAFADRWTTLGDSAFVSNPVEQLLSDEYAAQRFQSIDPAQAQKIPAAGSINDHDTTYFCVADREGNAISFIQSVFHGFGCGVAAEGTGVLFNNRMCGFSLDPASPNVLEPRKRPIHTLNAYLVTHNGQLAFVGGTPGGDIQVQSNLQILSHLIDDGLDPQSAIEQPRWAWQPETGVAPSAGRLLIENAPTGESITDALRVLGHDAYEVPFGQHPSAVQIIVRLPEGGYVGGSDPRTEGQVSGF